MNSSPAAASSLSDRIIGADRIHAARRFLIALLLLTASCLAIIAGDGQLRAERPNTMDRALFRELGLQYPALIPSGRMLRHPQFSRDGVDLRFSPTLPIFGTEPALLIIPLNGDRSGP